MNFRKLYRKLFGDDHEFDEVEKWFQEGRTSSEGVGDNGNEAKEDAEVLCKLLLDVKNEGIKKDQVAADMVPIIQNAADDGDGLAAYVMGLLYLNGLEIDGETVVDEDPDKMLEYLRMGAEAGNMFAQSEYGQELCIEKGDDEAGFSWIVKSGGKGNVFGLHRMTNAYIDGSYGQEVDLKKALECFKKIVEAKDDEEWPDEMIVRARGYLEFLPAIISGDVKAMRSLGEWLKVREGNWEYTWGYGDADSESEFWLKKAEGCK